MEYADVNEIEIGLYELFHNDLGFALFQVLLHHQVVEEANLLGITLENDTNDGLVVLLRTTVQVQAAALLLVTVVVHVAFTAGILGI